VIEFAHDIRPFTEVWAQRGGHRIRVRDYPGADPALVLMHGFPDNLHLYDRLLPHLDASRRVVTFDFLGWGGSDKPAGYPYTAHHQTGDIDAVITGLAPGASGSRRPRLVRPTRDRLGAHPSRPRSSGRQARPSRVSGLLGQASALRDSARCPCLTEPGTTSSCTGFAGPSATRSSTRPTVPAPFGDMSIRLRRKGGAERGVGKARTDVCLVQPVPRRSCVAAAPELSRAFGWPERGRARSMRSSWRPSSPYGTLLLIA